jgi:erythromycin esterase
MPPIRHDRLVRRALALVLAGAFGLAGAVAAPLAGAEAAPAAAKVSGTVVRPGGEPAAGAIVAVVARNRSEPAAVTVADAGGAFTVAVPAGSYALTATHPQWVAAYSPPAAVSGKVVRNLRLAPPAEGFLLAGEVRDSTGASLADARVHCVHNRLRGDYFIGRADGAGHYALRLPSAPYGCRAVAGEKRSAFFDVAAGAARQDLVIRLPVPAPQAVIDWIRGQAIPLLTPRAGHGFADLAPVRDVVGSARVVGLGEATHGTREHFQMKHRLLEYLVSELGFSVFAMENNWPESEAVDEYVRTGQGDLAQALSELFLVYNTEEVVDLIHWMRQWNAVPGHRQVRFYGFDMQAGAMAADRLTVRLQQVAPALAAEVAPALAKLAADERADGPTDEGLAAVAAVLPKIAARLGTQAAAAGRQGLVDRHYVQVLRQYIDFGSDPLGNPQVRDRAMADNVRWIADVAEPGSRLVLWAHNEHIADQNVRFTSMGHHLEAELGKDYLRVGFLFHHGGFQAVDATGGGRHGMNEFTVGPPPAGTLEDTFERAGWPLCLLDLRRLPVSGPVAEWFRGPQPMRWIGASFRSEDDMATEVVLPGKYEAVVYVEATTRARPNPPAKP